MHSSNALFIQNGQNGSQSSIGKMTAAPWQRSLAALLFEGADASLNPAIGVCSCQAEGQGSDRTQRPESRAFLPPHDSSSEETAVASVCRESNAFAYLEVLDSMPSAVASC